ncbi:MAG: ABC transporter ATP-binding protein [Candidatus Thorarchaeota archaeon SMTZ1-45]
MLEVRNLSFSYDGLTTVLDSVEFRLSPGEIVGMLGPTGSGKSTLAKILSGFIPRVIPGTFSGQVKISDTDVTSLPLSELARHVALVQQDPEGQICTLQVSDEVAFGPENYLLEASIIGGMVADSLEAVGAGHLKDRPTYALSGGEKQRAVIAAMLACRPQYLILDEPSSSLDPTGVAKLREVLLALKQENIGVLCIEHRLPTVLPIADRILELNDSRLSKWDSAVSSHQEVIQSEDTKLGIGQPIIRTEKISFSYGERTALRDVTFAAYPGEIIAVMGDNGSGKTTLLSLIGGLQNPDAGEVYLENHPIGSLAPSDLARRVAMVFQNPNHQIFEKSVWKEQILSLQVLELLTEDTREEAKRLLKLAGLEDIKERNPFSLSHGQKRRLNVASVIIHNPQVYLFDEPLIGQDLPGRQLMAETIRKRAETGGVSMIVTHDTAFALHHCNRILFMEEGSILLDGSPTSVMERLEKMGRLEYVETEVGA